MRTILNRWPVAAVVGLVAGIVVGVAVTTAMTRDLHLYMRFIGVCVIAAVGVGGLWVYRTYVRPDMPVVEETEGAR